MLGGQAFESQSCGQQIEDPRRRVDGVAAGQGCRQFGNLGVFRVRGAVGALGEGVAVQIWVVCRSRCAVQIWVYCVRVVDRRWGGAAYRMQEVMRIECRRTVYIRQEDLHSTTVGQ